MRGAPPSALGSVAGGPSAFRVPFCLEGTPWVLPLLLMGALVVAACGGDPTGAQANPAPPEVVPPQVVPAFPGAEGWGATALNACRSLPLRIHEVVTTADGGAGSLRDILEDRIDSRHYDIVLFRVGGTISLEGHQITARQGCVYLAGQTAPGDGIMIRSHPTRGLNGHLIRFTQESDIVVRYLRLRHGHEGGRIGGGLILTGSGAGRDIIYDHISASWGGGNTHLQVATSDPLNPHHTLRVSIQNSFIAEGIENRAASFRGASGDSFYGFRQLSYHRNLTAVVGQRHPQVLSGDARVSTDVGAEVVNNLMYAAKNRFTEAEAQTVLDFVKNYQDPGPDQASQINRWYRESGTLPLDPANPGSLYIEGNETLGDFEDDFESWVDRYDGSPLPSNFRRFTRLSPPRFPIREMSASEAREWILEHAGASRQITCDGRWVSNRDDVDQRIAAYVRQRGGPDDAFGLTVQELNGGWPVMEPGSPCADSDGDGLPDEWEFRFFGCATCASPNTLTASGYLLIEHYLNGTSPH